MSLDRPILRVTAARQPGKPDASGRWNAKAVCDQVRCKWHGTPDWNAPDRTGAGVQPRAPRTPHPAVLTSNSYGLASPPAPCRRAEGAGMCAAPPISGGWCRRRAGPGGTPGKRIWLSPDDPSGMPPPPTSPDNRRPRNRNGNPHAMSALPTTPASPAPPRTALTPTLCASAPLAAAPSAHRWRWRTYRIRAAVRRTRPATWQQRLRRLAWSLVRADRRTPRSTPDPES